MTTTSAKAAALLDSLAEDVLLVELSDMQLLADIHSRFQALIEALPPEIPMNARALAEACAVQVQKVILSEVPAEEALNALGDALAALQPVLRDGALLNLTPELSARFGLAGATVGELPCNVDAKIFAEFLAGQPANLDDFEQHLLTLDRADDADTLAALRRLIHTLKGETALLGINDVERLCHVMEDNLQTHYPRELGDAFFAALDWLRTTFTAIGKNMPFSSPESLIARFCAANAAQAETPAAPAAVAAPMPETKKEETEITESVPDIAGPQSESPAACEQKAAPLYRPLINPAGTDRELLGEFTEEAKEHCETADAQLLILENNFADKAAVDALFRVFHTMKGVAGFLGLEEISKLSNVTEDFLDRVRKKTLLLDSASLDVCFRCVDILKTMIQGLRQFLADGNVPAPHDGLDAMIEQVHCVLDGKSPVVPSESENTAAAAAAAVVAPAPEPYSYSAAAAPVSEENETPVVSGKGIHSPLGVKVVKETVRVDADRLDRMVDTIGELVIAESMVDQLVHNPGDSHIALLRQISQLGKITRELQEIGMSLRMMPIRATFQKMARLVRDLAHKSGKKVELITSGEDTELDKSLVDHIGDPLVHMVRNSVDHGIETDAAARAAAGKPPVGQVCLSAYHKGGSICIEIRDDGRGLDKEMIYQKAVERGLIASGANLSDNEIYRLIFEPGFSTADKVTDISGRGVGMDVVKRNIEMMRGRIDIDTIPGQGTIFVIRLPLTLAIIDGMVIRVGEERYIIPTLSILRSIQPTEKDISSVVGKGEMLRDEGHQLPMFRLHTFLHTKNAVTKAEDGIALIVEADGRRIAIFADEILEQQQIVIKSLGDSLTTAGIAGGAIMPDGRVGLILDIGGLMEMMEN